MGLSKSQKSKYLQPFLGLLWGVHQGREGAELVKPRNGGCPSSLPLERTPCPSPGGAGATGTVFEVQVDLV